MRLDSQCVRILESHLPLPSPSPGTAGPSDPPTADSQACDEDADSFCPLCLRELLRSHMSTRCALPPRLPHKSGLMAMMWTSGPSRGAGSLGQNYTLAALKDQYLFGTHATGSHTHDYIDHRRGPGTRGRGAAAGASDYFQRDGKQHCSKS